MLIQNATMVTADQTIETDILIENGLISEIKQNIQPKSGEKVIDAKGQYVIPGGVDVHTHLDLDVGIAIATDSFYTGTVAAACGGTTTIVDHIGFGPAGCKLSHQIDAYHKLADGEAVIDYGFHGVFQHIDDDILREMEDLIEQGITSYKAYLTYGFKLSDAEVFRALRRCKELGLMLTVHPENDGVVNLLRAEFENAHLGAPKYHPLSRPKEAEAEAINRMILFARIAKNVPLYIVHTTSGLALDYVRMARKLGQENLYVETCPQYLLLDDSRYDLPNDEGLKYIMSPPLRKKEDNEALWQGIADDTVQTIATDHCPFFFNKEKQMGKDDFTKCPNGAPGIEARVALMFSEGVMKKRITMNQFVQKCCEDPAKLFGLYPKKGTIAVGSDADLVLIDPNQQYILHDKDLHENVDYTPYEGFEMQGKITMTILRGEIIAQNGIFVGQKGQGQFIKRKKPMLI